MSQYSVFDFKEYGARRAWSLLGERKELLVKWHADLEVEKGWDGGVEK